MINIGDTVKVIGTTIGMQSPTAELIPIGNVCTVNDITDTAIGKVVLIEDESGSRFWYPIESVEKGHLEWVKDSQEQDDVRKIWLISGHNLPTLEIKANNFDSALAMARLVNRNYNTGQLKEDK